MVSTTLGRNGVLHTSCPLFHNLRPRFSQCSPTDAAPIFTRSLFFRSVFFYTHLFIALLLFFLVEVLRYGDFPV